MKSHSKKDIPEPVERPNKTTRKAIQSVKDGKLKSYGTVSELMDELSNTDSAD